MYFIVVDEDIFLYKFVHKYIPIFECNLNIVFLNQFVWFYIFWNLIWEFSILIFFKEKNQNFLLIKKKLQGELSIILLYISIIIYNYFCNDFVVSIFFLLICVCMCVLKWIIFDWNHLTRTIKAWLYFYWLVFTYMHTTHI